MIREPATARDFRRPRRGVDMESHLRSGDESHAPGLAPPQHLSAPARGAMMDRRDATRAGRGIQEGVEVRVSERRRRFVPRVRARSAVLRRDVRGGRHPARRLPPDDGVPRGARGRGPREAPGQRLPPLPARRHHLHGARRGGRDGADHPPRLRSAPDGGGGMGPHRAGPQAAPRRHQPLPPGHLPRGAFPARRAGPPRSRLRLPEVPHRDAGDRRPARRLRRGVRDRPGSHPERVRGARGQPPGSVGGLLHARVPGCGEGCVPRSLPRPPGARGVRLQRTAVRDPRLPRAVDADPPGRDTDSGPLQLRLLRARPARRRNGSRPRRGTGPRDARRGPLRAHHEGARAHRRPLSPARRRLPRSGDVSSRVRAGGRRACSTPIGRGASCSPTHRAPGSPTTRRCTPTCPGSSGTFSTRSRSSTTWRRIFAGSPRGSPIPSSTSKTWW